MPTKRVTLRMHKALNEKDENILAALSDLRDRRIADAVRRLVHVLGPVAQEKARILFAPKEKL